MKHLVSVKNKTNRMKKKKYLHTQFVKFLLESESQAQKELDEIEKEFDDSDSDEVIIPVKKGNKLKEVEIDDEVIDDEIDDEMDADKVIEKLILQKNKYKQEYENILRGRKRK
jgi:molybdopterin-biosynthesis enzyme MoeA-like protein